MSSTETEEDDIALHGAMLLDLARRAIVTGFSGERLRIVPDDHPITLRGHRASFVTLQRRRRLRGCIGSLEARQSLVEDIAWNAFNAAFKDPRFPPLGAEEMSDTEVHLSVLSPPAPLPVNSEADLLRQLRPGVDGLILSEGARRSTFLPSVWAQLPAPAEFVRQLKLKAGLDAAHWSDTLSFQRYTTLAIP
jgi:AmmeMemoRadiSam system protein A